MANGGKINQRLSGINPLAYLGNDSYQPPEFVTQRRAPTTTDRKNYQIGAIWLDTSAYPSDPVLDDVYMLVALSGGSATWVNFGGTGIQFLTGNSGGAVGPDGSDNINVLGDGTTINIVGDPGTNTLTVSLVAGTVIETITGDSGGPVSPDSGGNITIVGTGVITVVGDPGTNTLTVTPDGSIASSFITNPATGTATPVLGVLTFAGTGGVTVTNAGSTVTIDGGGAALSLTADDANTVTDTAGVINIAGGNNIATTGTVGPNTLTVNLDGITQYSVQVGGASDDLTQIVNGTTGQVLTAVTSGDPIWATNASSSSTANFTPAMAFGGGTTGLTYTLQAGTYVQIADICFLTINFKLSNKGSSTGDATITGLPFTVKNSGPPPYWQSQAATLGTGVVNLDANYTNFYALYNANTTTASYYQFGDAQTEITLDDTNFTNTSTFLIMGWYQID